MSITAPSDRRRRCRGASVAVAATAADNVGVAGVQFKLDGANLGAEDTTAPYAITWDSTTASNGGHTLTAVARDAAGNTTTSAVVSVTVSNVDSTAPTVSITAPTTGATVAGASVVVSATAADNVGVAGVQFKLDGANLGAEDTTAPYAITWDSTTASNGGHTLTAVARDAAGNTTTSAVVTVTVSNVGACTQVVLNLSTANVFSDGGFSYIVYPFGPVGTPPDNSTNPAQSMLRLFENGVVMGPAHSLHSSIRTLGQGRFSHWSATDGSGEALRLSALDNTNPLTNGRRYAYCVPGV